MIIETILNALVALVKGVFGWISFPAVSDDFYEALNVFIELLENGRSLINLFLPWELVRIGLPLVLFIMNFEHIYYFVVWILKKIPMLNIK